MYIGIYNMSPDLRSRDNVSIQVYDLEGTFQRRFGMRGTGPGQLRFPAGLALSGDNQLYVCDSNHRVLVYELDGSDVRSWGSEGAGPDEFSGPSGLAIQLR